ncbi:MAG: REP-associated tyrosine transposase [Patescibacteria group bacterium]|nr:REP-associated tyrosine transposase [Patescibacteria group bacterium]
MSIRKVNLVPGEYYHIYNRGNSKQKIFNDNEDYLRFLGLLFACNQEANFKIDNLNKGQNLYDIDRSKQLVSIGSYCLMPNHFHLIITDTREGNISKFMQKVTTAYVMYYNKKYKRTGSLFEGKFKSQHAGTNKYLKYLFAYTHLNPVKLIDSDWKEKGIKNKKETLEYLHKYAYSSFLDYAGAERVQSKILSRKDFPDYFPSKNLFQKEIFEWLSYGDVSR